MIRQGEKIKVLVVDDSALMRKMIPMIITADKDIEVVGTAMDGDFALKKIPELRPDVITLDIDMPRMDGLTTLSAIVKNYRIPVILVSSLTKQGAEITLRGLEIGAFDFVSKPHDAISVHISQISHELIEKIIAASRWSAPHFKTPVPVKNKPLIQAARPHLTPSSDYIVAIGISTGGPQTLAEILPLLAGDFPAGLLIVQHMPEGFTDIFAKRLDSLSSIQVKEAVSGDIVCPGRAYIAPGGKHMKVKKTAFGIITVISQSPQDASHRPSANVLFRSVAEEFGSKAIGVIMTGMGDDGVDGLREIQRKGGTTIAQDEKTSIIYGMPKVAAEKGVADMVLGLDEIVPRLNAIVRNGGQDIPHAEQPNTVMISR